MQNMNQPIQTGILRDNAMRLGQFNQSVNPSKKNRSAKVPPAGLQMAPCGCYFDPRIYRMEWVHNEFPQSSVCKLIQVPGIQSMPKTNWTDSQRYLKNPVQPTAYTHHQHTTKHQHNKEKKQHTLSHYNQGDSTNVTRPDNVIGPLQETPQAEILKDTKQAQQKKVRLPDLEITIPGLNLDGNTTQAREDIDLIERFLSKELFQLASMNEHPQETQMNESNQEKQTNSGGNCQVNNLIPDAGGKQICSTNENMPINSPSNLLCNPKSANEQMNHPHFLLERQAVDVTPYCSLPNEVLLEDAIKMFGCIPGNVDTKVSNGNLRCGHGQYVDSKDTLEIDDMDVQAPTCHLPCKEDALGDLSALNLPEELLHADYSVPEICDKMSSMACFDNIGEIIEIPLWDGSLNFNVIDNLCNQLTKQNSPCPKKRSTSPTNAPNESYKLPKSSTSPITYYMGNEECLDKMEDY